MGERLKTIREPIAWVVLAVSIGYVVLALVQTGLMIVRDHESWTRIGGAMGGGTLSAALVLALVAAVLSCLLVRPPTPRVRLLALMGATVLTVVAALELVFTILGGVTSANTLAVVLEIVGGLLGVGFTAALAAVLWKAWQHSPAPILPVPDVVETEPHDATGQSTHEPTWHPDRAVGSSWTRAGDAATGASASSYGTAGARTSGWQVPEPSSTPADSTPGGWVPPSQQALPPARAPWATAFEAAQGEPVGPADTTTPPDPAAGTDGATDGATDGRWTPTWRPFDPPRS